MLGLNLPSGPLAILCLGAHADDIEIGAAGALLTILGERPGSEVTWVIATAPGTRKAEAVSSAEELLDGVARLGVRVFDLKESYLDRSDEAKATLAAVREELPSPDVIFTHHHDDRHQDHRAIAYLTWQLWRDHLILEYEIPKWDGDLGRPNAYVPLTESTANRKVRHLARHFASQRGKDWYDAQTFLGLMRLRGMECRAPSHYAEAFHARKLVFA